MTTPNRKAIIEKAVELFHADRFRNGDPAFAISPTEQELAENGCLSAAQSELMRDTTKNVSEEWKGYDEKLETVVDFQFDTKEAMRTTTFVSGSRGVGKSDVCMRIAEQLQNEGIIVIAFDPSMDWRKRSNIEKYITVKPFSELPIPETSTIFDISRLTPNQAQQCVEGFSKKLFEFQIDNSAKRFYIIFEESQIYFPLFALSSKNTQNTMRVLTVGRNFNISLAAISQFPALVSKELVKHSQQIWIGCCAEPNTLKYWHGLIGKYSEKLRRLSNGQFVYYCRNKISLTEIEPYDNNTFKTEIRQHSVPEPEPKPPIPSNHAAFITLMRLGIIAAFAILFLKGLK
jgi:hypothetical protein